MGAKGWSIFAGVTIIVLGTLIYFSGSNRLDVSDVDANAIIAAEERNGNIGDHTLGTVGSKVVLIEYGDFQCPGCAGSYAPLKALVEKYDDNMLFIFRHLPLSEIHQHSRAAAATAEAAGKQGKFWEMSGKLFTGQNAWKNLSATERSATFSDYATELGLDMATFERDLASEAITQKINFDQAVFRTTGLQKSTPAFILNGKQLTANAADEAFEKAIREAITSAGGILPPEDTSAKASE